MEEITFIVGIGIKEAARHLRDLTEGQIDMIAVSNSLTFSNCTSQSLDLMNSHRARLENGISMDS